MTKGKSACRGKLWLQFLPSKLVQDGSNQTNLVWPKRFLSVRWLLYNSEGLHDSWSPSIWLPVRSGREKAQLNRGNFPLDVSKKVFFFLCECLVCTTKFSVFFLLCIYLRWVPHLNTNNDVGILNDHKLLFLIKSRIFPVIDSISVYIFLVRLSDRDRGVYLEEIQPSRTMFYYV